MTPPRILMATFGSRGDVEPFVALAQGLIADGAEVAICTATRFKDWIEGAGVGFLPTTSELLDLMDTDEARALMEGAGGTLGAMRAGLKLARAAAPLNAQMMNETWEGAQGFAPDMIVFHPKSLAAPHIAEKLDIPAAIVALQPMYVPTSAFPAPGVPTLPLGGAYNRLTYALISAGYGAYRKPVSRFRKRALGLRPIRKAREVMQPAGAGPIPVLHAVSPHVLPRPADWPDDVHMTGYWRLKRDEDWRPPAELDAFLNSGEPPVYVGFGSMISADPQALADVVAEALEIAGVRGLISSGWGGLKTDDASRRVMTIGAVPHDWLFPRCAAVVHHGGAGTTAAGFRAGVPSVICPFFGDQPFWAQRSVALGVGAAPVPRKELTARRLARSIRKAVSDKKMRERAVELGRKLRDEDGVAVAVKMLRERSERT